MSDNGERDLGFTWRENKNGQVAILRKGKRAATLRGNRAVKFLNAAHERSLGDSQQLMARWTGNYKHGNERVAGNHRRNRDASDRTVQRKMRVKRWVDSNAK